MTTAPRIRAVESGGRSLEDPSGEALYDMLSEMNLWHRFVIVERLDREPAGQHYMQVRLEDDFGYRVEYREGGPDRHFQAHVPAPHELVAPEPVAGVLADWARDGTQWRGALPWVPWRPDGT